MAAVLASSCSISSSPIAGSNYGGFVNGTLDSSTRTSSCSDGAAFVDLPQNGVLASSLDRNLNPGKQQQCSVSNSVSGSSRRYSQIGWSRSIQHGRGGGDGTGEAGKGLGRGVSEKQQRQRRGAAVVVRAVTEKDESFLQNFGTQFFKAGGGGTKAGGRGTKAESATSGNNARSGGTQFFGIGGKKKKEEPPPEEPSKRGGTQLFGFGTVKKAAGEAAASGTRAANATTNGSARKGTVALDALSFGRGRRLDPKIVFVAGAMGQIGSRISQQLLRAGFTVRGGVPDLYFAQQLADFATQYGVISRDEAKRLNPVEFDFKNVSSIARALGNAGKVIVTIGPNEDGPLGKVTRDDAARVVEAASLSNAAHFVLVSEPSVGLSTDSGPLAGLTALFSRVFSKDADISEAKLVEKIIETKMPYTIIKAGSTDGVDDFAAEGGNLVVEAEGASEPSAKVSKIQIASAVAGVFQFTGVSENKFVEISSSPYAPSRPVDELLREVQVDGRREILQEKQARLAAEEKEKELRLKVESEAEEATEDARRAAQLALQLEAEAKKLAAEEAKAAAAVSKAQAKADAAAGVVDGLQVKVKELGPSVGPGTTRSGTATGTVRSSGTASVKAGTASVKADDAVKKSFSFPFGKKQQAEPPAPEPVPAAAPKPAPKSGGGLFGLFGSQEAVYVDDD